MPPLGRRFGTHLGLQHQCPLDQLARPLRRPFGIQTEAFGDQRRQFRLLVATPFTLHFAGHAPRCGDVAALDQHPRQVGKVIDAAQAGAAAAFDDPAIGLFGGEEILVLRRGVTDQTLAHGIVWRDIGGPLQRRLRLGVILARLMHRGEKIVGTEVVGRLVDDLLGQPLRLVQGPAVPQRNRQPHFCPGHDPAFEHPAEDRLGLLRPAQLVEDFTLETQGVVHVNRLLLNDAVAGVNRLFQGAALKVLVDFSQYVLLVNRLDQPRLQLLGGEGLDQVIVRRQLGQRDDIGLAALAGDDQVNRR